MWEHSGEEWPPVSRSVTAHIGKRMAGEKKQQAERPAELRHYDQCQKRKPSNQPSLRAPRNGVPRQSGIVHTRSNTATESHGANQDTASKDQHHVKTAVPTWAGLDQGAADEGQQAHAQTETTGYPGTPACM